MLKKSLIFTLVLSTLLFFASCTKDKDNNSSAATSRPAGTVSKAETSKEVSRETSRTDNASIGDDSKGIIDDIVSGAGSVAGDIVSGATGK